MVIRGSHRLDFSDPIWPEIKIKISFWAHTLPKEKLKFQPETKNKVFFYRHGPAIFSLNFGSDCLNDFKTSLFSYLHIINIFFLLMIYLSIIY